MKTGSERVMEREQVAGRLEARRQELAAELEQLRRPVREPGSQPQYGKRIGDHTVEAIEQRSRAAAAERLQRMADEVERALAKLSEGSYGRCDRCRQLIPPERLEALPWATLCIDCRGLASRERVRR